MKSLEKLYEEAGKNPELVSAFTEAVEKNRLEGFLKEQSCGASLEEAQAFLTAQLGKTQALSDEELDNVAGGKGGNSDEEATVMCSNCRKFFKLSCVNFHDGMINCPYCGHDCRRDIYICQMSKQH